MNKLTALLLLTSCISVAAVASSDHHLMHEPSMIANESKESNHEEKVHPEHHSDKGFYLVTKALATMGEEVTEGAGITLASGNGGGVGVDIGYKLPAQFALEFDFSYDTNTVTKDDLGTITTGSGQYMTYGLDITYTIHLTHALGLMGKVGYEVEDEKIAGLIEEKIGQGAVYGLGLEYAFNTHYEFVAEYEHSFIASTRGSSIFSGIKYNF